MGLAVVLVLAIAHRKTVCDHVARRPEYNGSIVIPAEILSAFEDEIGRGMSSSLEAAEAAGRESTWTRDSRRMARHSFGSLLVHELALPVCLHRPSDR